MKKNVLVIFNMQIGDYEHSDQYIFDKEMTEYQYCKKFWSLSKKNELKTNVFWDNQCLNAISVYSKTQLSDEQAYTLQELGLA